MSFYWGDDLYQSGMSESEYGSLDYGLAKLAKKAKSEIERLERHNKELEWRVRVLEEHQEELIMAEIGEFVRSRKWWQL